MPTFTCANGHQSTTSDYCSECGKKLTGGDSSAVSGAPAATAAGSSEKCPDCDTARANGTAVFCEVCRYNFVTRQPWAPAAPLPTAASSQPVVPVTPPLQQAAMPVGPSLQQATLPGSAPADSAPAAPPTHPVPDVAPMDSLRRWEAAVVVDPALYLDPDPAVLCPVGAPERVFPLDFAENLIGRRSERRAIYPEIDMSSDHGVSSRHAVIYREGDGSLTLLDVGSTNGTQVNGKDLAPGVRLALQDGDQITLGCWTRISIRAAQRAVVQP